MKKKLLIFNMIFTLAISMSISVYAADATSSGQENEPNMESNSLLEINEPENGERELSLNKPDEYVDQVENKEENIQNLDDSESESNSDEEKDAEEKSTFSESDLKMELSAVTDLKAISKGKNRVQLSWNAVEGAEEYIIYRQIGKSKFSYLYVTKNQTYLDTSASGVDYNFYRVYPSYISTEGKRITGASDKYVYTKAILGAISNLKADSAGKNKVKITWDRVIGADGYIIYRQIGKGSFSYRYITENLSYVDMTASSAEYSYYRVYPYYKQDGKNVTGSSNKYVYAKGILSAVTGVKAVGQSGGVKLSWNKMADADGYLIYRKTEKGEYKYRSMTSGTQFIDNTASQKEMNFYWVFPYFKENGQMIAGKSAKYVYAKGMPSINYGLYDTIIKKYVKAMTEKWDMSTLLENKLCYLCAYDKSLSDIGYTLMDLDNNGVKELIISPRNVDKFYKGMIYDLYTIKGGKTIQITTSAERDRYYLCKNNKLAEEGSGSAFNSFWCFFNLKNGSELSVIEGVVYDGYLDAENPWFYIKSKNFEQSQYVPITESRGRQIIDSYEHIEISSTPLSEY